MLRRNCPLKHVIGGKMRGMGRSEEDISICWMTIRKQENTVTSKRQH